MYKWEYVKGQRAPNVRLSANPTDGPAPLTVNFSSEGTADPDPGDSIRFEWDFGDGSPISTESNPTHTYTQRGRYTAVLRVFDSSGEQAAASTIITVGNTSPTVVVNLPLDGGLFSFGDKIPYSVTVTDPEDGAARCEDIQVTFVLGHDTHGHAEESKTGCSGFLQTLPDDVAHGGNVFGVISASYTDKGGPGGVPSLTTTEQVQIRQRRQEVEHATQPVRHQHRPQHRRGSGHAPRQPEQQRLDPAERPVQPAPDRLADVPGGGRPERPHGRLAAGGDRRAAGLDHRSESSTTASLVSTGGTGTWTSQTVPIRRSRRSTRGSGCTSCSSCSGR